MQKENPKSRIDVDFKKYYCRQSEELSTESVDNVDKSVDRWISLQMPHSWSSRILSRNKVYAVESYRLFFKQSSLKQDEKSSELSLTMPQSVYIMYKTALK